MREPAAGSQGTMARSLIAIGTPRPRPVRRQWWGWWLCSPRNRCRDGSGRRLFPFRSQGSAVGFSQPVQVLPQPSLLFLRVAQLGWPGCSGRHRRADSQYRGERKSSSPAAGNSEKGTSHNAPRASSRKYPATKFRCRMSLPNRPQAAIPSSLVSKRLGNLCSGVLVSQVSSSGRLRSASSATDLRVAEA